MLSKNSKDESKKANSHQINTEKLYLFRRVCEESAKKQYGFANLFKRKIYWPELQAALKLVEIYEETSIEELTKNIKEQDNILSSKIIYFNKSKFWTTTMPESKLFGLDRLFPNKKENKSKKPIFQFSPK